MNLIKQIIMKLLVKKKQHKQELKLTVAHIESKESQMRAVREDKYLQALYKSLAEIEFNVRPRFSIGHSIYSLHRVLYKVMFSNEEEILINKIRYMITKRLQDNYPLLLEKHDPITELPICHDIQPIWQGWDDVESELNETRI